MKYIKDKYKGQKYMNFFDDLKIITRFDNNTPIKNMKGIMNNYTTYILIG